MANNNNNLVTFVPSYAYAASLVAFKIASDKRAKLAEKVESLKRFYAETSDEVQVAIAALRSFEKNEKTVEAFKREEDYNNLSDEERDIVNMGAGILPQKLVDNKTFMADMEETHKQASMSILKGDTLRDLVAAAGKVYGLKLKAYREEDGTISQAYNTMATTGFKVTPNSEPIKIQKRKARNWEKITAIYLYACFLTR